MFSISIAVSMLHTDAPGLFLRSGAFTLCSVLTDAIDGQQVSMQPDCLSQPLTYPPDLCFLFWREWSPELQSTNADSSSLQNAQVTPPVIPPLIPVLIAAAGSESDTGSDSAADFSDFAALDLPR